MDSTTIGILTLGAGLGLIHAFDADHVAAVSSLAGRKGRPWAGPSYALRWAVGHGAALLIIGALTLLVGIRLPDWIFASAEKAVGVILVGVGASILCSLWRRGVRLRPHRHDGVEHAHLVAAETEPEGGHDHAPMLVGVVHGLAGSAPALAMIPAARSEPLVGLLYLAVFSLGVSAGMITVGLLLGRLQHFLSRARAGLHELGQLVLGVAATVLGVVWLAQ